MFSNKKISIKDSKTNLYYWSLMQNIFLEQITRILQKNYRKKHNKIFKKTFQETLTTPLSLHFIQEPWGTKANQHARRINRDYLQLDFKDPEFIRNIYKACHQIKITSEQLATALLLYIATHELRSTEPIYKFHFNDEKGPYSLQSISYATSEKISSFKSSLEKIYPSEQYYFAIPLNKTLETSILKRCLLEYHPKAITLLGTYINRISYSKRDATQLLESVKKSMKENRINSQLLKYLEHDEKISGENSFSSQNIHFLLSLLQTNSQIPSLLPTHNPDKHSALFYFILPTIAAFKLLLKSFHSEKDYVYPYLTAGIFYPIHVTQFDKAISSHPIELIHPDLVYNPKKFGKFSVTPFFSIWHDLFRCWQGSSNPFKPTMRFLRQIISNEKNITMSKAIWSLTRIDIDYGRAFHEATFISEKKEIMKNFYWEILSIGTHFWQKLESDENLLIIVDMIKNTERWKNIFNVIPEKIYSRDVYPEKLYTLIKFQTIFNELKNLIQNNPGKNNKFYILAYRLQNSSLYNQINCEKELKWRKNGGLYFTKTNMDLEKTNISNLKYILQPSSPSFFKMSQNKVIAAIFALFVFYILNWKISISETPKPH